MDKAERDEQMIASAKEGKSLLEIAEEHKITRERARQILKKKGVNVRELRKEKAQIILDEVKDTLGLTTKVDVKTADFLRRNVKININALQQANRQKACVALYEGGAEPHDIAIALNLTRQTVYKHLHNAGYTLLLSKEELKVRNEEIKVAFGEGKTIGELAEKYQMSAANVGMIAHGRKSKKYDPEKYKVKKDRLRELDNLKPFRNGNADNNSNN